MANYSHVNGDGAIVATNGIHSKHTQASANGILGHENTLANPIAVCGMALRLPGGLRSPQEFWKFLLNKGDARCRVPKSRFNIDAYYAPGKKPAHVGTEYGFFLDEDVDLSTVDTSFFSPGRVETGRLDPQQRLLLETAREAFEDAGVTGWKGKSIGSYVGNFGEDWQEMSYQDNQPYGIHRVASTQDFMVANRISYEMGLHGPSMTIRTACSSSLAALNEACMAMSRGDCEAALVSGVNLILTPTMMSKMTEQGVLSPDGSCKTFSADADGYGRGEAATSIFVKPLAHAIRDGNPIRAVIRATSLNANGNLGAGLSVPSTDAQERLMRHAYSLAGISDLGATAMVECHGTGTAVGDPIECGAVARVFGNKNSGIFIGSVKPNVGHTEGASGLVSIIKMVLALENQTIPPNIRFTSPNPKIPFEEAKLIVPLEPTPWPKNKLERVSINSFGIGGSNSHVILESAVEAGVAISAPKRTEGPYLFLYSAQTAKSLDKMASQYEEWAMLNAEKAQDLAFTLALRREHLSYRSFAIFNNTMAVKAPPAVKGARKPSIIMVFTGQGAQWPRMGRELLLTHKIFQDTIKSLDAALNACFEEGPGYSIEEELLKPVNLSRVSKAAISQPLSTAVQIALVQTLRGVGVMPDAVVGHSSGEIAAAFASGALNAQEAIIAAHFRGAVVEIQQREGAMAAIGMGWEEVEAYVSREHAVVIACDNSPQSVTISGDAQAVQRVVRTIKHEKPEKLAKLLQVDKAYHSSHMAEIGQEYLQFMGSHVQGRAPIIPFFSSVTGEKLPLAQTLDANYWKSNLESPVLFQSAVTSALQHDSGKDALFLEVGPHSALSAPLRQILTKNASQAPYVPVMLRNQDCTESLFKAIGKLYTHHVSLDLNALFPEGITLKDLPTYPWNREGSHWSESRLSQEWRHMKFPYHDLLGVRVTQNTDLEPTWRNMFHLENVPWIRDHKIGDDIIFPFCGYLAAAGEAARQMSGIDAAYSIRNMTVNNALILTEGKPTEIVTTLRPQRLTNSLNSQWWEFMVASYVGNTWTKHASGEVMAVAEPNLKIAGNTVALPRKTGTWFLYNSMHRNNLCLGTSFQTLDHVETSTNTDNLAVSQVIDRKTGDESFYHIHPTRLDATFQLAMAAAVNGHMRKIRCWLPVSVEKIIVERCSADMICEVKAHLSSNESIHGNGRTVSGGKTVVEAFGIVASPAEAAPQNDLFAGCRLTWDSDIHFTDIQSCIQTSSAQVQYEHELDNLCQLYLLSIVDKVPDLDTVSPHLADYVNWIREQTTQISREHCCMNHDEISARIDDLEIRLSGTPVHAAAKVVKQLSVNFGLVCSGMRIADIVSESSLDEFYKLLDDVKISEILRRLGHSKPNMTVLEIGNGRQSVAQDVISSLTTLDGHVLCSKYTLTSTGYISKKNQSEVFDRMEYLTLDISQDLADQGLENRKFDLVIVNNVLRTTRSMEKSLTNCRSLLATDGKLILHELSFFSRCANYIFGTQPGWLERVQDLSKPSRGKPSQDLSVSEWKHVLATAGIECQEAANPNPTGASQLMTTLLACKSLPHTLPRNLVILCENEEAPEIHTLSCAFRATGYSVDTCNLEQIPPKNTDVVSLLDLNGPFFANLDPTKFQALKNFVGNIGPAGMFWVTSSCQVDCKDPSFGLVTGFARTMRSEMLIDFATCEVPSFSLVDHIVRIFCRFNSRNLRADELIDLEYIVDNGDIKVGRYYPFNMNEELTTADPDDIAVLDVATPGRVNTLHWTGKERTPLYGDQVEIEVVSAGLNFRDILVAMGIVELSTRQFGLEVSGIVRRVGPNVKNLQVGDKVLSLHKNALASFATSPEYLFAKMPENMSYDEAATFLGSYVTAWFSLVNVAHLQRGQKVLIHSACGGVGLASIQVATMLGAEIFVTVGSEQKVQFLMQRFQIPRNRIFNSRNSSFLDGILKETGGKGVDVALNSLSGELLHATWNCVAPWGHMVEIGKRDLLGGGKLDMRPFLANRSYTCVDIDPLTDRPEVIQSIIQSVVKAYEQGIIQSIRPIKTFKAAEIQDAFRYMQKGSHIGRICISMRDSSSLKTQDFSTAKKRRHLKLKSRSSYILVGGLGGLGRAIATWMAEAGAEEIVFMARSAGTRPDHHLIAEELFSMGCSAKFVQGDVTHVEDVDRAVRACTYPVKGIHQMAMVLQDQSFSKMTFEDWNRCTTPKVTGTWNLHNATVAAGIALDFFVLFSSISGVVGQLGQSNYASANTFLSSMAQYRNRLGLAASVVDIGAIQGLGVVETIDNMEHTLRSVGFTPINEAQLLDSMLIAMMPPTDHIQQKFSSDRSGLFAPYILTLGLSANSLSGSASQRVVWRNDRRMAVYHNYTRSHGMQQSGANKVLKELLDSAKNDVSLLGTAGTAQVIAMEIGKKLFDLLLKDHEDLNIRLPLVDLGLDSLVAIELRAWWKQAFKFDISTLEMLGMGSLEALGSHAVKSLQALYSKGSAERLP